MENPPKVQNGDEKEETVKSTESTLSTSANLESDHWHPYLLNAIYDDAFLPILTVRHSHSELLISH